MIIVATAWGSSDPINDYFETIESFLSTALVDADATSPFAVLDCVDKLTNQIRIALLLANERIFRSVNGNEFITAIETLVVIKNEKQISWARVGGIGLILQKQDKSLQGICMAQSLNQQFSKQEPQPQLPLDALGLNSSCNLQFGDLQAEEGDQFFLISGTDLIRPIFCDSSESFDLQKITQKIIKNNPNSSFWLGSIELE